MKLKLLAFGRLKTGGLRETADYYIRNLRPWTHLEEIELKAVSVPDKSEATRARIREAESRLLTAQLEQQLSSRGAFYLLDEDGKHQETLAWSKMARDWEDQGIPEVAFCLGGSLGFHESLKKRARGVLSLGPQTMSHELARVVLLEQLYRAWSVNRGHPYHNEG